MNLDLAERLVVVTGASSGIGLACARAFAREGARVVGVARAMGTLRAAQQQLLADGLAMTVESADLCESAATMALMARIAGRHGPVAVLVNCAGAAHRCPPEELDDTALRQAMESKYFITMHAIEAVMRDMAERGRGSIVNVIGQGGRQASAMHIGGGAANAALMLATVGYANAYAARGVRINGINPGITRTRRLDEGLAASARASGRAPDAILHEQLAQLPMGRVAEPEEVADVALFLASARASYVTGAIVPMDGGKASVI